jgi:hypothetical protein
MSRLDSSIRSVEIGCLLAILGRGRAAGTRGQVARRRPTPRPVTPRPGRRFGSPAASWGAAMTSPVPAWPSRWTTHAGWSWWRCRTRRASSGPATPAPYAAVWHSAPRPAAGARRRPAPALIDDVVDAGRARSIQGAEAQHDPVDPDGTGDRRLQVADGCVRLRRRGRRVQIQRIRLRLGGRAGCGPFGTVRRSPSPRVAAVVRSTNHRRPQSCDSDAPTCRTQPNMQVGPAGRTGRCRRPAAWETKVPVIAGRSPLQRTAPRL